MISHRLFANLSVFLVLSVLFLTGSATCVQADAATDARKAIQTAIDKEDAAVARKDIKKAFSACASDFQASDGKGHSAALAELKKQLQAVFQSTQSLKVKNTIQKMSVQGNRATVTLTGHIEMILSAPSGGKTTTAVIDQVEEEVWNRSAAGWLRKSALLISQKMTKDGKPFAPGK